MLNVCKDLDNSHFILIFASLNLKATNNYGKKFHFSL